MNIATRIYHQAGMSDPPALGKVNEVTSMEVTAADDMVDALVLLVSVTGNSNSGRSPA